MSRLAIALFAGAVSLVAPVAALAAWNQPVGGPNPINNQAGSGGGFQSMVTLAGAPHVAWSEFDGDNSEIRVARLNGPGTDWEEIVGGASPINNNSVNNAGNPSITVVEGVLHVAWSEADDLGINQIRVARLNAAGTDWVEVVGGSSPINAEPTLEAFHPSLAAIGGRPWVAWREDEANNNEIHVSRLNAAGDAWEESAGGINATSITDATDPSLTAVGGVPYVAWSERDAVNDEIRVARMPGVFGDPWEDVGPPDSPVNIASDRNGVSPSMASVGGVPHVSWHETNGTNFEVRVARLNGAGTEFEEIVGGASPINHASGANGNATGEGNLLDVGGVPYVTWSEYDGVNSEIRVSRLNAAGTGWQQIVGGDTPINEASDRDAINPFMTHTGGVPYVSWAEDDGVANEMRVARLEPDFVGVTETATDFAATLTAQVRTFGVPLPVAFELGPGAGFGTETAPVTVQSGNSDSATTTAALPGLTSFTDYSWRAFGTDLSRRTSIGPTRGFRTPDTGTPSITGARAVPAVFAATAARPAQRRRAPRGTSFRFGLSEAARVVFTIQRRTVGRRVGRSCRKQTRRNRSRRRCTRHVRVGGLTHQGAAGANRRSFSGRIRRKRLRPGRYRAVLVARDPAGNRSTPARVRFRVVRR